MNCSDYNPMQQGDVKTMLKCAPRSMAAQLPPVRELLPTPSRRIDLKTIRQARKEMAAVYRDVRFGRLESSEGTRLVYVLSQIAKLIEIGELEKRLDHLERMNDGKH